MTLEELNEMKRKLESLQQKVAMVLGEKNTKIKLKNEILKKYGCSTIDEYKALATELEQKAEKKKIELEAYISETTKILKELGI